MGLVVEHISKSFAQFLAVADLSMQVKESSIFGFLGANGAGKTTTMRMILDIIRPYDHRHLCLRVVCCSHLSHWDIDVRTKTRSGANCEDGAYEIETGRDMPKP